MSSMRRHSTRRRRRRRAGGGGGGGRAKDSLAQRPPARQPLYSERTYQATQRDLIILVDISLVFYWLNHAWQLSPPINVWFSATACVHGNTASFHVAFVRSLAATVMNDLSQASARSPARGRFATPSLRGGGGGLGRGAPRPT